MIKQRSLECDERDTPSEDVSQWTMSASKEAIANDNNKAENEESLSKYAVSLARDVFTFSFIFIKKTLQILFASADYV